MKILELRAENFKKLRIVEIRPDGNLVQLTGRNGQGKSSVLDAMWFALKGKAALPMKAVRRGTEKMKVRLETEEFTVTRTMTQDGAIPTLLLEMKQGKERDRTPQDFLDQVFGALTFDPLAFIQMDREEQVATLRRTAKVDVDFQALDEANQVDYDARLLAGRELKHLESQLKNINVLDGLPKKKIDEDAILAKLNNAGEANRKAQELFKAKQDLGAHAASLGVRKVQCERNVEGLEGKIEALKEELKKSELELKHAHKDLKDTAGAQQIAEENFRKAPEGDQVDVVALTSELGAAQRTNRAIDQREAWENLRRRRDLKQGEIDKLNNQMDARDEKKRNAIANAKIPVDGLTFDERQVLFNGLPLENLGEGEQIRISTQIGMAANPKLRVLCIRHGEALDEDGLKILAELAAENDFQIWMARVDSSGKVGIVLEDGMIAATSEEE